MAGLRSKGGPRSQASDQWAKLEKRSKAGAARPLPSDSPFLASDDASFVNEVVVTAYAGWTLVKRNRLKNGNRASEKSKIISG